MIPGLEKIKVNPMYDWLCFKTCDIIKGSEYGECHNDDRYLI